MCTDRLYATLRSTKKVRKAFISRAQARVRRDHLMCMMLILTKTQKEK